MAGPNAFAERIFRTQADYWDLFFRSVIGQYIYSANPTHL